MPRRKSSKPSGSPKPPVPLTVPDTGKQVFVAAFLAELRKTGLHSAVREAASKIDPTVLRAELVKHAPAAGLLALQGTGVRDEEVFATPSVFRAAPGTVAYYRLLLGISQKQFYPKATGLNIFKPMEERQKVTVVAERRLDDLCDVLNEAMAKMVRSLTVGSLRADVDELPLLTLGAQADGSWRTQIGSKATKKVFVALKDIVRGAGRPFTETASSITVTNSSNRKVTLMLAPDPDVVIREQFGTTSLYKVAVEIKGGTDYANIHNRVGEAEKSHQKAKRGGAVTCWTVISCARADMAKLKQESPTTTEWLDFAQVSKKAGAAWDRLDQLVRSVMGI